MQLNKSEHTNNGDRIVNLINSSISMPLKMSMTVYENMKKFHLCMI